MAGFSNDVMYANNVDFSGGKSATVTTDGQLLIGSTALPHIKVGTLTAGNGITITNGSGAITIASTASATDLHVAKLIVNPAANAGGNFTTISSALGSAVSGDTIFIMPGTYTENLTLKAGVNLTAFECDSGGSINFGTDTPHVKIIGKATATFAGTATLSGIFFQTNSDFVLVVSGTAATMVCFKSCFFNGANNSVFSGTSSGSGAVINLLECWGNLATTGINYFALSNGCGMNIWYSYLFNSGASTTANTVANGGAIQIFYSAIINPTTTSNTASLGGIWSEFFGTNATALTIGGTGNSFLFHSRIESGSGTAISIGAGATLPVLNSAISSSNAAAIAGAGTIQYANLTFTSSSSAITTTTQSILSTGPSATFGSSNSGNTNTLQITNSSNTGSSRANVTASVGGTSSEDGSFSSVITGGQTWSWGGDNSDSDAFVISANASLGTTNVMRVATTGEINFPLQSCFLSIQASTATNATGDATNYTLGSTVDLTEIYDQNSDFDPTTGIYTAPITARVFLSTSITVTGGTAMTQINPSIVTSNRTYQQQSAYGAAAVVTNIGLTRESDCDMDAADTATATISIVDSGGKVDDIFGAATDQWTGFSGHIFA